MKTQFVFFGLLIAFCLFMANCQTSNMENNLAIEASLVEENPAEVEPIGEVEGNPEMDAEPVGEVEENPEMNAEPVGEVENISINISQVAGN